MCRTFSFSSTRPLLDTALAVCIVVLASHFPLSAREAAVDPRLTISVRMYTDLEPIAVDLDAARAHVEAAFRPTGIQIEWLPCHRLPAPSHCQSPPAADELVVRMAMGNEAAPGPLVALGVSLVDRHTRSGCYATVYVNRVVALARSVNVGAGTLLGRAIAHEIGHLLLGTSGHARGGLMRRIWSPAELQRNDSDDWIFLDQEIKAMRTAVAMRLARSALASR